MKLLDKYLLRRFIALFVYALVAFLTIFLIVDVVENIDKFIDAGLTRNQVLKYYLLNLPFFISTGLPMAMLIASIFSIGTLSKNNEITAIKVCGVSLYRIVAPVLLFSLMVSVGSFFFDDQVKIHTDRKLTEYKERYFKNRSPDRKNNRTNIFIQDSPRRNLIIRKFNGNTMQGQGATIQYLSENELTRRIDAIRIFWSDSLSTWKVGNYIVREFRESGGEMITERDSGVTEVQLNVQPGDIMKESIDPAQMDFQELSEFIDQLKMLGISPRKWLVNLHFKIAFAFTNFVVVLFGLPLVANQQHGGIAFGAGLSIFIIFTYYAFIKIGQVMGFNGLLPPFLSVWIGNFIFILGGIILLIRTPK